MVMTLDDEGYDLLFRKARTANSFVDKPVPAELLHRLYELMKFGPTSANCSPARVLFLTTPAARERLRPALSENNLAKTLAAPVAAIIAFDLDFARHLPRLFPHVDARPWFADPKVAEITAFRNGSLQGAYLIMAARSLGLDCGPMSGFDNAKVDAEFFPEGRVKSNFLCTLGYIDGQSLFPRNPRLTFDEACQVL